MFDVKITRKPPEDNIGHKWDSNHAVMVELVREFWEDGDILITVSLAGEIVGLSHVTRRETVDRLESLVSIFPHAGKVLLGRSIAIAKHDAVSLQIKSRPLPSTVGFYRHCRALREVSELCFISN